MLQTMHFKKNVPLEGAQVHLIYLIALMDNKVSVILQLLKKIMGGGYEDVRFL